MLLILGFRVSSSLLTVLTYACERCGVTGSHDLVEQVRRLTLFFVPLLPVGGRKYVDTCSQCGRTIEVSREQADAAMVPGPPAAHLPAPGPQDSPAWQPQDVPSWRPQDR